MTETGMIERVALACVRRWMNAPLLTEAEVAKRWVSWDDAMKEPWRATARAAIAAMRDPSEMTISAGQDATLSGEDYCRCPADLLANAWRAMIDEALRSP